MTCLEVEPVETTAADDGDGLTHIVCCEAATVALCGADVETAGWLCGDDEDLCVVCADLEPTFNDCPHGS